MIFNVETPLTINQPLMLDQALMMYLNSFTRRLQVLSHHSTDVLMVVGVATNSVVVVGIDLIADRLVQFVYQRVAFLLRQLRILLRDLLELVADHFLTKIIQTC